MMSNNRHIDNAEHCMCCGAVIPEGRQVCIICGLKANYKQSTADVAEVRHGENITKMHPTDEFICSECGLIMRDFEEIRVDEENDECYYEFEFKYCPKCGAKMDGKG